MFYYSPNPSGVVFCNSFKWDILLFILIENHVICVPSTTTKWISFCNHGNRKLVGGKHSVLVLYVNASASNPSCFVLCKSFKWDILYSFLIKNHVVVFVPSTTVNCNLFNNNKNKIVVGGNCNMLVYPVHLVLPSATLSNETVCVHFFWSKSIILLFLCLPQQWNEFHSATTGTEKLYVANTMF